MTRVKGGTVARARRKKVLNNGVRYDRSFLRRPQTAFPQSDRSLGACDRGVRSYTQSGNCYFDGDWRVEAL